MENKPLLSIIVPVYNVESYLENCLDSILNQDYDNIEVVLVNDGSTDNSENICKAYVQKDCRFHLISQTNGGLANARNTGLSNISGELVTFIDSDDAIEPETYSSAIKILYDNKECDHVQFPLHKLYGTSNNYIEPYQTKSITGLTELINNWVVDRNISWIVCNKIFKAKTLGMLRFKDGFVYEDNIFVCEYLKKSKGICFSTEGAYRYYYRGGSITNTWNRKNWSDMIKIHSFIYDEIKKLDNVDKAISHISYIISNDMFNVLRGGFIKKNELLSLSKQSLVELDVRTFLFESSLDLRKRIKILGMKLYSHLF